MNRIALFLNRVLHGQSVQYDLVHNFRNMHAMFQRFDFIAYSSRVNIEEPVFRCTIPSLLAVTRVVLPSFLIPTEMLYSKSLNTSMVEIMVSFKYEYVFIRDLSDLTVHIVSDTWWASMNVGSKHSIAWNNSRHADSWWFNLHCGVDETGSTGIIRVICHQLLRYPSEHRTCLMRKHWLAKVHIANLNKSTELAVTELTNSMVKETALAILKR